MASTMVSEREFERNFSGAVQRRRNGRRLTRGFISMRQFFSRGLRPNSTQDTLMAATLSVYFLWNIVEGKKSLLPTQFLANQFFNTLCNFHILYRTENH